MKQSRYFAVYFLRKYYDLEKIQQIMTTVSYIRYYLRYDLLNEIDVIVMDIQLQKKTTPYALSNLLKTLVDVYQSVHVLQSLVVATAVTRGSFQESVSISTYLFSDDLEAQKVTEKRKRQVEDLIEKYGVESVAADVTDYFQVNPIIKKSKTYLPRVNKNLSAVSEIASILKRCEEMTK